MGNYDNHIPDVPSIFFLKFILLCKTTKQMLKSKRVFVLPLTVFACQSCLHAMLLILPNNWINFWKKILLFFYLDVNICCFWCVMLWLLALKFKCKAKRSQLDKTHRPYGWLLFLVNVTIVTIILIIVNMQMSFAVSHIFLRRKKLVFWMWKLIVMIIVSYSLVSNKRGAQISILVWTLY